MAILQQQGRQLLQFQTVRGVPTITHPSTPTAHPPPHHTHTTTPPSHTPGEFVKTVTSKADIVKTITNGMLDFVKRFTIYRMDIVK